MGSITPNLPIQDIIQFYIQARRMTETELVDGANLRPRFSLRTLCRALEFTKDIIPYKFGFDRALYEGISMSFLTMLDDASRLKMIQYIKSVFAKKLNEKQLSLPPKRPSNKDDDQQWIQIDKYWLKRGTEPIQDYSVPDEKGHIKFVLTKSTQERVSELCRTILTGKYPVLLQVFPFCILL